MKVPYAYLAALGLAGASLSSCSRASYSFNSSAPAYLSTTAGTAPRTAPAMPQPIAAETPAVAVASAPARPVAATSPARLVAGPVHTAPAYTAPVAATETSRHAKPTLVQRLVLKKVSRQLAKAQRHDQNTASIANTAARGGSFTVAIIGLIALVVGLIVSSGLLITIGSIVLVVGLILAILSIF